jgi:predicted phage-related endonuclease
MMQLAAEQLTGTSHDTTRVTAEMQRGTDLEPVARTLFSLQTGLTVEQTGFLIDISMPGMGASPDGMLVEEDAIIEIKVPNTSTHLSYFLDKKLPAKYKAQVHAQLLVTGRSFAYFVSYDDRVPAHLQLLIVRVERDNDYIQIMRSKVAQFLKELDMLLETLKTGK